MKRLVVQNSLNSSNFLMYLKTLELLKNEIATYDITKRAGINFINVLLIGEISKNYYIIYHL